MLTRIRKGFPLSFEIRNLNHHLDRDIIYNKHALNLTVSYYTNCSTHQVLCGKFWQSKTASQMEIVRQLCLSKNPQPSICLREIRREHSKELLPLHRTFHGRILTFLLIYKFRCSSSQRRQHIHYLPLLSSHNLVEFHST